MGCSWHPSAPCVMTQTAAWASDVLFPLQVWQFQNMTFHNRLQSCCHIGEGMWRLEECDKDVCNGCERMWPPPWTCPLQGRGLFFFSTTGPNQGKVAGWRFMWTFRGQHLQTEGQQKELTVSLCSTAPLAGPNHTLQQRHQTPQESLLHFFIFVSTKKFQYKTFDTRQSWVHSPREKWRLWINEEFKQKFPVESLWNFVLREETSLDHLGF